jgi:hypothetical protein
MILSLRKKYHERKHWLERQVMIVVGSVKLALYLRRKLRKKGFYLE